MLKKNYANTKVAFVKRGKTILEKFLEAATPGTGNVFFPEDVSKRQGWMPGLIV